MAQIAIPIVLFGVAYLVSNDENKKSKDQGKEGFSKVNDVKNQGNLLANENKNYYPNIDKTKNNVNNEETLSQYQDKYFIKDVRETQGENEFETLAGNKIKSTDINHNNMNVFYSSKSNGYSDLHQQSILDTYTGQGTYAIEKEEVAPLFKPETNIQNVYGNQNQNDFMQSRVNASQRHANTKPWEEIKDTPGLGMKYDEKNMQGLNNYQNRELYTPKNVDELRVSNNPKMVYKLDNHMGPAINPVTKQGHQGKVVKQNPDSYFKNDNNLGMLAYGSGIKPRQKPQQMMTCENRASTSVEYYGARGSGEENVSYIKGEYMDPNRQSLSGNPMINMSAKEKNPTNELNYGKDSYKTFPNNRTTTNDSYIGNIGGMISNVVEPIFNGLRHSKKSNIITNQNVNGYVNGGYKQPMVYDPNQQVSTTNREMYEGQLSMGHLNVQKQDKTAYMNTRPLLNDTQRSTMNQSESGPAQSHVKETKNLESILNQRNQNKVHAENVHSNGNMSLFNNKVKMIDTNKEICNGRQTPFYNPQNTNYGQHPTDRLGSFTQMPQEYENKANHYVEPSLLKAFKQNPYTQSLQSAV
jgi:hypothetical protein